MGRGYKEDKVFMSDCFFYRCSCKFVEVTYSLLSFPSSFCLSFFFLFFFFFVLSFFFFSFFCLRIILTGKHYRRSNNIKIFLGYQLTDNLFARWEKTTGCVEREWLCYMSLLCPPLHRSLFSMQLRAAFALAATRTSFLLLFFVFV